MVYLRNLTSWAMIAICFFGWWAPAHGAELEEAQLAASEGRYSDVVNLLTGVLEQKGLDWGCEHTFVRDNANYHIYICTRQDPDEHDMPLWKRQLEEAHAGGKKQKGRRKKKKKKSTT